MAIIIIVRLMMTSMTTMMREMMPIGIAYGKKGGFQIMAKSKMTTTYTPFVPYDNLTNVYLVMLWDFLSKMKLDTLLWVSFDRGPPALCRCPNCRAFVIGGEEGCGNNLSPEPASVPSWGKRGEGERRQGRRGRGFGAVWPPLGSNSYPLPPMDLPHPTVKFSLLKLVFLLGLNHAQNSPGRSSILEVTVLVLGARESG